MNTYGCSNGNRLPKSVIDRLIREAKEQKIDNTLRDKGFISCEECGVNSNAGLPIDCSHTISVKECQESGRSELAFDISNIILLCRRCHSKHDKLY